MSMNIALEREQEQRVENDRGAVEYRIEWESIEGIKRQGKEDGREGKFPSDPNSLFYYVAWCEGYREYALAQKERELNSGWEDLAF